MSSLLIITALSLMNPSLEKQSLESALQDISPEIKKWASIVVVQGTDENPKFEWHHIRDSENAVDFWPASTIKIYTVVAALEYLNELKMDLDSTLIFERRTEGKWVLDSSRTMREMISEVFNRSSNEDYTLLLRFTGIDRINTRFLIPEKGFPHSALMRGYVRGRPYEYVRSEPQRITVRNQNGKSITVEHVWSGTSYSKKRGATIICETTGNCTSTRELAECMRRIMFHEYLAPQERYNLTAEQVDFIRYGAGGLTGLENREAGPYAWKNAADHILPNARYFHKGGLISTYTLDAAYIEDSASKTRFILAIAAESGKNETVTKMAEKITKWVLEQNKTDSSN